MQKLRALQPIILFMKHNIDQIRLDNKVILITGAGDGIGKAVALDCANRGATVILLGKTVQKLENVYDEIIEKNLATPAIYPLNMEGATPNDYDDLHENINNEFGRLDGLVNNAGWLGASSPIQQYDTELWYRVMQVNLNAPFMITKACIPLLLKADSASVVFTTDPKNSAYWGAYGVAKAGLQSLMQILSEELESKNIPVNAINPGPVRTHLRSRAYAAEDPNKLNKPDDVTDAFIYLLSLSDTNETGQTFSIADFD